MEMKTLVCKACGGKLDFDGTKIIKCEYCGTTNIINYASLINTGGKNLVCLYMK